MAHVYNVAYVAVLGPPRVSLSQACVRWNAGHTSRMLCVCTIWECVNSIHVYVHYIWEC